MKIIKPALVALFLILVCSKCNFYTQADIPKTYYFIHEGNGDYGRIAYTFDGHYVRNGYNRYGEVIYTCIDGDVKRGYGDYGTTVYHYDGHNITSALMPTYGKIIYTYDNHYIRENNKIIYTITKEE